MLKRTSLNLRIYLCYSIGLPCSNKYLGSSTTARFQITRSPLWLLQACRCGTNCTRQVTGGSWCRLTAALFELSYPVVLAAMNENTEPHFKKMLPASFPDTFIISSDLSSVERLQIWRLMTSRRWTLSPGLQRSKFFLFPNTDWTVQGWENNMKDIKTHTGWLPTS